jgi:hypothetical protein
VTQDEDAANIEASAPGGVGLLIIDMINAMDFAGAEAIRPKQRDGRQTVVRRPMSVIEESRAGREVGQLHPLVALLGPVHLAHRTGPGLGGEGLAEPLQKSAVDAELWAMTNAAPAANDPTAAGSMECPATISSVMPVIW